MITVRERKSTESGKNKHLIADGLLTSLINRSNTKRVAGWIQRVSQPRICTFPRTGVFLGFLVYVQKLERPFKKISENRTK